MADPNFESIRFKNLHELDFPEQTEVIAETSSNLPPNSLVSTNMEINAQVISALANKREQVGKLSLPRSEDYSYRIL